MTKWEEIAKIFNLELEEKFKLKYGKVPGEETYKFTENGIKYRTSKDEWDDDFDNTLEAIVKEECEIVKMPWKPKDQETYFYPWLYADGTLDVLSIPWDETGSDYIYHKLGLVFKTRKEATEKGIPLMREIIEEFNND